MPFVTEVIWRALHGLTDDDVDTALMRAAWPVQLLEVDAQAEEEFAAVQEVVTELRKLRAGYQLPPARRIQVAAVCDGTVRTVLQAGQEGVERLAGVDRWTFVDHAPEGLVGKVMAAGAELYVSLEGIVDPQAELNRLKAELADAEGELSRAQGKLANQKFVANAPEALVDAERQKVTHYTELIAQLRQQVAGMDDTDG